MAVLRLHTCKVRTALETSATLTFVRPTLVYTGSCFTADKRASFTNLYTSRASKSDKGRPSSCQTVQRSVYADRLFISRNVGFEVLGLLCISFRGFRLLLIRMNKCVITLAVLPTVVRITF